MKLCEQIIQINDAMRSIEIKLTGGFAIYAVLAMIYPVLAFAAWLIRFIIRFVKGLF